MDKHTVGQPSPAIQDEIPGDYISQEWLDFKITFINPPDISAVIQHAENKWLRAQAAQPLQHGQHAGQGGSAGAVPIAAPATAQSPTLAWPPGRAGRLAQFIHDSSYSPVREVAITATLGLLAGVCGRAYRTHTGKDLALYMILVARSGIGKDGIHEGIPKLIELAAVPTARRFVRSQDYVSGEALHKELLQDPGFLNLQGEFGRKLKRMSNPTDTPMQQFRTVMTNAYGKRHLEGKTYSNADKNMIGVEWPALSFLGETTPGTFFECLTPDMMEDGFMSRFLVVSYDGERPLPNKEPPPALPPEDLAQWADLVRQAIKYQTPIDTPPPCVVEVSADAYEKLERFELHCIDSVNATDDEAERQVWNRAHLKALKVASLLAVADHYLYPQIQMEHAAWALTLVRQDIAVFQSRKRNGDIGTDDSARERKLVAFMRDYLVKAPPASYKIPDAMQRANIVPRAYLQIRASTLPAFTNHKAGKNSALDLTLRSLQDDGVIEEMKKLVLVESYGFHGKAYRILRLPG